MIKPWLCGSSEGEKLLFCFDFDQTIVKGHFHHLLTVERNKITSSGKNKKFDVVNHTKVLLNDSSVGLKNPDKLKEAIQLALQNGHHVAITSFTSYPETFIPTLEKLGLSKDEIDLIPGISGFPASNNVGKNDHIRQAMARFGINNNKSVWLIDDDPSNCDRARAEGFQAVVVPVNNNSKGSVQDRDSDQDYLREVLKAASHRSRAT